MNHPWPGNVRELKNTIESMVVVDYDGILDIDDLTEDIQASNSAGRRSDGQRRNASLVGRTLEQVEKYYIAETLRTTNGNREEAAKLLGIGERTLYRKLKEYEIG